MITHTLDMTSAAGDPARFVDQEWLLTAGNGTYAAGTPLGVNTRRYHGMLIASTHPPVGRIVALHQLFERLTFHFPDGDHTIEPCANLFLSDADRWVFAPGGHDKLTSFTKGTQVAWTYQWRGYALTRTLWLHWKQHAVTVRYTLEHERGHATPVTLAVRPMTSLRDFHGVCQRHSGLTVAGEGDTLRVSRPGAAVTIRGRGAAATVEPTWWNGLYLPLDARRSQESREDWFVPGVLTWTKWDVKRPAVLTAALGELPAEPEADNAVRDAHLKPLIAAVKPITDLPQVLAIAADDFVVERRMAGETLSTILAGYPWFADWGRDTFIALEGLLLITGRHAEARDTLRVFASAIRDGLVPNRFDDYDESAAHYNTVDGSLWYIHAALRYLDTTGDRDAWTDFLSPACHAIINGYLHGTHGPIRVTGDGLVEAGTPDTQLTWMDAKCGDIAFTPRYGKAVEINALWYRVLTGLAAVDPSVADHYLRLAGRTKRAFTKVFFDDAKGRLIDHVYTNRLGESVNDPAMRPNQIFAASLPDSPLPLTKQKQVVAAVRDHLLTPSGLRTLPPEDPNYHGRYVGDLFQRDKSYHQGTVWPWLIGPYAEAVLRTGKFSAASKREALAAITPLLERMQGQGLGQLHEIHDANAPHAPVGCFAQAWSVAEVIRVLHLIHAEK